VITCCANAILLQVTTACSGKKNPYVCSFIVIMSALPLLAEITPHKIYETEHTLHFNGYFSR